MYAVRPIRSGNLYPCCFAEIPPLHFFTKVSTLNLSEDWAFRKNSVA